jgi:L-amino acid N-acyltransferase YncA
VGAAFEGESTTDEAAGLKSRAAVTADCEAMGAIYNAAMEERIATFETRPRTTGEIAGWMDGRHPVVVVERNGQVVGFAAASLYRARECYSGVAEFSVYVAGEARGRGAGRLAMETLIDAARKAGFWKLVSRVFVENLPSRALLASVGFREVGIYQKHGRLDGQWRDVVIVERLLEFEKA